MPAITSPPGGRGRESMHLSVHGDGNTHTGHDHDLKRIADGRPDPAVEASGCRSLWRAGDAMVSFARSTVGSGMFMDSSTCSAIVFSSAS